MGPFLFVFHVNYILTSCFSIANHLICRVLFQWVQDIWLQKFSGSCYCYPVFALSWKQQVHPKPAVLLFLRPQPPCVTERHLSLPRLSPQPPAEPCQLGRCRGRGGGRAGPGGQLLPCDGLLLGSGIVQLLQLSSGLRRHGNTTAEWQQALPMLQEWKRKMLG